MMTNSYWFSLKPHIYVEFKDCEILLYDTQKGNYLEVLAKDIISSIEEMYEDKNLGVSELHRNVYEILKNKEIIDEIVNQGMADLVPIKQDTPRPIRLIPILNLQSDVDRIKEKVKNEDERAILLGKDILKYLFEVNIYLNNNCDINCSLCHEYSKQIPYCITKESSAELSLDTIKNIFQQIKYSSVYRINLLGGDISKYKYIDQLQELIHPVKKKIHCYFYYKKYPNVKLVEALNLEMLIDSPVDESILEDIFAKSEANIATHFVIKNEEDYDNAESIIQKYGLTKYELHPYFTGDNLTFFEENIFLEQDDIFSKTYEMREIFRNQKANLNFFGKLYILPNGTVKANMNKESLGNITTDTILELVNKELIENTAWRCVRDKSPCNECLNKHICPPISNYEFALGKYNLCSVR